MERLVFAVLACSLASAVGTELAADENFISEPQDVSTIPGSTIQLDCELTEANIGDICAWRISGTHLGVDHFYNENTPPNVQPLFPEHERVCSLLIMNIDWRFDGFWTCWPLAAESHISSRAARVSVAGATTSQPTTSTVQTTTMKPATETTTVRPITETTSVKTTPETTTTRTSSAPTSPSAEPSSELPPTTPAPASTTSATSKSPVTTTVAPPTTSALPSTSTLTTDTPSSSAVPTTGPPAPSTFTTALPSGTTTAAPPTTSALPITTTQPHPTPSFVCPQPNGLFADPDNRQYYFYCQDNVAVHMQCESPQYWNDIQKQCV